jgi:DNA repair exonuclease SbcCD ATPase subunit
MDDTTPQQDAPATPTEPVINDHSAALDAATQVSFLVKQLIGEIDNLRERLKEHRSMVKDAFGTHIEHKTVSDQIRDLNRKKKEIGQGIANSEAVRQARNEIKVLSEDLKTVEKKLSGYLQQYIEMFNSRTVEDPHGNLKEIVTLHKLISRSAPQPK